MIGAGSLRTGTDCRSLYPAELCGFLAFAPLLDLAEALTRLLCLPVLRGDIHRPPFECERLRTGAHRSGDRAESGEIVVVGRGKLCGPSSKRECFLGVP